MEKNFVVSSCESVPTDNEASPSHNDEAKLAAAGLERRRDNLIYWRSDCKDHPRNWSARRKVFDTTVIILLEFYTWV
jgi:hypothetical protein